VIFDKFFIPFTTIFDFGIISNRTKSIHIPSKYCPLSRTSNMKKKVVGVGKTLSKLRLSLSFFVGDEVMDFTSFGSKIFEFGDLVREVNLGSENDSSSSTIDKHQNNHSAVIIIINRARQVRQNKK